MKAALYTLSNHGIVKHPTAKQVDENKVQLVLCFAAREVLINNNLYQLLQSKFPSAEIAICSTAGEIHHTEVLDASATITAFEFGTTRVRTCSVLIDECNNSFDAGEKLMRKFDVNGLRYVLVLSDGSKVNGSELVCGINEVTNNNILVTGGLAGDGSRFQSTLVGANSEVRQGMIVGIGFYGDALQVQHGCKGGWETFGLEKAVTRSESNILFEVDDKNALELYKKYLGQEAEALPGSALLFPLAVILPGAEQPIVRTILSIDEKAGSMTFAGDIPVGSKVRFMRANFDKLTNAASVAASEAHSLKNSSPDFALLISCVGRKLILQSRVEEEVEAVYEVFGDNTPLSGFYSYGEISPLLHGEGCQLHNQTMTITTFHETE